MRWLLQTNLYAEDGWDRLVSALERRDLPYSVHQVVPFAGTLLPEPEPIAPGEKVIVMGSYTLARYAAERGWTPGSYLDNLDFEVQRAQWGTRMFNHDAVVCRFADVPPQESPFFLRPVLDSKSFTGQVYDWPSFVEWRDRVLALVPEDHATVTADTIVMVCTRKEIYSEVRTWVVGGRVVTASQYKLGTLKRYAEVRDHEAIRFAEACAAVWQPNRAFVLDVFETPDGPTIGEVNNLNSAGFYEADVGRLIEALEDLEAG